MSTKIRPGLWALFLLSLLFYGASEASVYCGIKPILPIGCEDAVCVCDDDGECRWVYVCD